MMNLTRIVRARPAVSRVAPKLFSTMPANLQLADLKIFDPVPKPLMNEVHYHFPVTNVPSTIDVYKFGTTVEIVEPTPLVKKVFEVPIRVDIINDVVRYIRHKLRQPQKTKNMSEISGSNKKPYGQKKTGRSQIGHKRNSSVRGGAKAHGRRLRDYRISLNKKYRALGTMMTLAAKYREGNLVVFDHLECESHKTRDLVDILTTHGLHDRHTMFIDEELNKNFVLASNNLQLALTKELKDMTIYEILKKEKLVMSRRAFEQIQEDVIRLYTRKNAANKFVVESMSVLQEAVAFCEDDASGYYVVNHHDVHDDDEEEEDDEGDYDGEEIVEEDKVKVVSTAKGLVIE